jgi:hypothetical protein
VAISYEMIHDTRIIYTDGRPHINNGIRQYLGDSRGWWEGDTLVVETTNLTDQTSIGANGNGLRHSDKMTMVERIRRVADEIVQYQLTVIDPETYPRPFTISIPLTPLDGGVLLPYECHEGNGAVRNALAALGDSAMPQPRRHACLRWSAIAGLIVRGGPAGPGRLTGSGARPAAARRRRRWSSARRPAPRSGSARPCRSSGSANRCAA